MSSASERTPLIRVERDDEAQPPPSLPDAPIIDFRQRLYSFLEARTPAGFLYERFIVLLIVINVIAFILGSLFLPEYNKQAQSWATREEGLCRALDTLFFGNFPDNHLAILNIGSTSVLEIATIVVFSIEYLLRLYTADLESERYKGFWGRIRYVPTFFSMVDLASTVPFYIDSFVLRHTDIAASSFLRMFRLLRMMRAEGRYDTALTMIDDVFVAQKSILFTALFIGVTIWLAVSSLYYLAERRNNDMIYCPTCEDVDTSACEIDSWGLVNCSMAGCLGSEDNEYPCYNLYESIPMASYYSLLNLFGEYPLIDQHSTMGKIVGTITAVVAVAVFALPAGIIGNGFERVITRKREANGRDADKQSPIIEESLPTLNFRATDSTLRGRVYNTLHSRTAPGAVIIDHVINVLVVVTAVSFMLDTVEGLSERVLATLEVIELLSVFIFSVEYCLRIWSVVEDPKYSRSGGRLLFATTFLALVDVLSFAPYWVEVVLVGQITPFSTSSPSIWSDVVKSLRLLRIFRFERYTHAFLSFDDVIQRNFDILAVTAFTAVLFWILFASCLYFSERDSPDNEMASFYNTIPNSMWVTLLNLSGESPLAQYSAAGKVVTGVLGLFATAIFGIPIGVLGAGFEEVIAEENKDNTEEISTPVSVSSTNANSNIGSPIEKAAFNFVNGKGSRFSGWFEASIYLLIFVTVAAGAWQTVEGQQNAFHEIEWIAVAIFTAEYFIRLIGAGADAEFANGNAIQTRVRFLFSFYSIIDLLAIVPFYIAYALPESFMNDYDEFLRMLRILRLVKLDKYIPSISLIDDVIRLKFNSLRVAFYAAITLWVTFSALLFLCEHRDVGNDIDPVPMYGCDDDCTMADRFRDFFDSMAYTGIHLTGDYPIITYSWTARATCFFMVIAAVGVVSIPSGIIASGFVEIVQSKNKIEDATELAPGARVGDDWYEHRYRELEGVDPPLSKWGPSVDRWQFFVNEYLNGRQTADGHHRWTRVGAASRAFIFVVIISNVFAVLLESIPAIDKAVGNQSGNFFDRFEFFSVLVFATEYILRLFCAQKNREALFSSTVYATTFFGIVDFLSTAPWFIERGLIASGALDANGDSKIFRIFRIFRVLQLEDFVTAFSKLDNVFRASKNVLKATGLLAIIIWVGCGALFFIFEVDNPNWRACDASIPLRAGKHHTSPGCFDFPSTEACNDFYPGLCSQSAFTNMPNSLYYTAVFLGGEWGVVDFSWPGRLICLFLCVIGIGLYAIPIGTLFDSFGSVLGMNGEDDSDDDDEAAGNQSS